MPKQLSNITPDIVKSYQDEISKNSSSATFKRKSVSLNKFFDWAKSNGHIDDNPLKKLQPQVENPYLIVKQTNYKKIGLRATAILGITTGLVILIFLLINKLPQAINVIKTPAQNIVNLPQKSASPLATKAPLLTDKTAVIGSWNLYASLRLNDEDGTPKVGNQNISFKVYNSEESSTPLYESPIKSVTTDVNGTALISLDSVPTNLFFENNKLYLEPEVNNEVASARIPISTANTPANLNGYFPSETASEQTIPVIDASGSLVLASESPSIKATAGNFLIEGQAVTLKTADGTDGNIEINPDGKGYAHFLFEGTNNNFLNAQAPNLTKGSLYYGIVANNATGYDLVRLQNGSKTPVTRFSVDALGNTFMTGNAVVQGQLSVNGIVNNGNYIQTQDPGEYASITKTGTALSDVMTLTLDERGKPLTSNTNYSTLVLNRYDGSNTAGALKVETGNAIFNGQVQLGRYATTPSGIGQGSLVYNTSDNQVYVFNGTVWTAIGSGSSIAFNDILSGTNTSAVMLVGTGASLGFTGSGTINASTLNGTSDTSFLRSDTSDNFTSGTLTTDTGTTLDIQGNLTLDSSAGSSGQLITSQGSGTPTWSNIISLLTAGTDISITGTTNATINNTSTLDTVTDRGASTSNTITIGNLIDSGLTANKPVFTNGSSQLVSTGTLLADQGGTGFSSYTVGDILYADTTTTLGKLADTAVGNVLISGGVGTAPSWGKVTLGTHTTGNYVSSITGTANQITASAGTGDVTLTIPSDFRAPGTVNAVSGVYTGAGAGTQRISSSGNLTNIGTTQLNGITYTWPGSQSLNYVLVTDGSGSLSWADPSVLTGGANYWELSGGVLYPKNSSADVLFGGLATASAKFAFTNIDSGTPTASIAGSTTNVATYLTGNGNLATTNMSHLTIGGSTTGGVDFNSTITSGTWNGSTITAPYGGTGFSSYAVGDLLYADTTTSLAKLADVATGNVLISGGVGTAPSWGKVTLGTHTTGNYVSSITGTTNQITASSATGDVTLSIPSDFRAPGTVNAVSGVYTGAGAGTIRIDASGNITANDITADGNTILGNATTDTVTFNGRVAQDSDLLPITTTGTNDLGSALLPWDNVYGVAVYQNGNVVCDISGNCPGSTNYWNQNLGAVYPANNGVDLLVGSNATTSAKFAFINVLTGTPTASIAGTTANVATYLTGEGNLAVTNMANLTIGGTTTGNVIINSNGTASLTANGANLTTPGDVAINGGDITSTASTLNINAGGNIDIQDVLNADTITTDTGGVTIASGQSYSGLGAVTLSSGGSSSLSLNSASNTIVIDSTDTTLTASGLANITTASTLTFSGDISLTGGDVTGAGGATLDLGEAVSGDITVTGDLIVANGSFLGLSSSTGRIMFTDAGTDEIEIQTANLDLNGNIAINIGNSGTDFDTSGGLTLAGDLIVNGNSTIGNAITDTVDFQARVIQDADLIPITTTGTNDLGSALLPWDNVYATAFTQNGNTVCDSSGNCAGSVNYWGQTSGALYDLNNTVDLLVGSNATTSAKFAFINVLTGTPTASIAGTTANVATYLTGEGNLATTNMNHLTLGGSTTGQIDVSNDLNLATSKSLLINNVSILNATTLGSSVVNSSLTSVGALATGSIASGFGSITTTNAITGGDLTGNGNIVLGDAITDTITFNGRVAQDSDLIPITATGTNDLGSALLPWDNIYGVSFNQNGNLVCDASGVGCPANSLLWQLNNKIVSPSNSTYDLAIGGTATGSAFQVFGIENSNGDIAKINSSVITTGNVFEATASAITSGNLIKLGQGGDTSFTGNGLLMDFDNTGGGSFTGNFLRFDKATSTVLTVDADGDIATIGDLAINGDDISSDGDLTITPAGGQVIFADTSTLNVGGLTNVAYNAFANGADTPTATNITADNDLFVGGDLELKGGLYLTGRNIYNVVGGVSTTTIALAVDPSLVDSYNTLTNGSWLVQNNTNNGIAALMVDQVKGGDILTASASGVTKFTIDRTGNITNAGTGANFTFSGTGNHAISNSSAGTNLTIDAGTTGLVQIGNTSTGNVELAGGSGATGCTITNSTGDLTCSGDLAINGGNLTTALTADSTLTVTGTLTANGTLDANGLFTLGDNGETGAIDTSDWDINATGDLTGIGAIGTDGDITITQATPSLLLVDSTATSDDFSINVDASTFVIRNDTDANNPLSIDGTGNVTILGDLAITGGNITTALTADSTLTVTGTLTANGTLDANGLFTLGDNGETGAIDTSDWDINATGDLTGIGAIGTDGDITITQATPSLLLVDSTAASDDFSINVDASAFTIRNDTDANNPLSIDGTGNFTLLGDLTITGGNITNALILDSTLGVTGTLSANGNLAIGDASGDTVTVNSNSWTFANDTNFVLSGGVNGLSFDTSTLSIDATGDMVGIGTTAPDRKLDVLDASNPQVRLTHTDGSVYTDFQTNSSGNLTVTPTGGHSGMLVSTGSIYANKVNTSYYSYFGDEFSTLFTTLTADSAALAANIGESEVWGFDENTQANLSSPSDATNGLVSIGGTSGGGTTAGMMFLSDDSVANNASTQYATSNKPIYISKHRARTNNVSSTACFFSGFSSQTSADSGADCTTGASNSLVGFQNTTTTLQAVVGNASAETTLTCTGATITVNQWYWVRAEIFSSSSVKFWYDMNLNDGTVDESYCGEITTNIPTADMGLAVNFGTSNGDNVTFDTDYVRVWQDDQPEDLSKYDEDLLTTYNPETSSDIAERYLAEDPANTVQGNIVSLGHRNFTVKNSDTPYNPNAIGIVSTSPHTLMGQAWDNLGPTEQTVPVALSGRVPVNIDPNSDPIMIGDFITSSGNQGLGMKAINSGYTVGRALEPWTKESGKTSILVFVNLTYHDSDMRLTDTGDINISKIENNYQISNKSDNSIITKIGAFANIIVGNIKSGYSEAQELVSENLIAKSIKTNLIAPIDDTTDVTIQVGSVATPSGKLAITNALNEEVAVIDNLGNASFAGTVKAQNIDEIEALLTQIQFDQSIMHQYEDVATSSAVSNLYVLEQASINSLSITEDLSLSRLNSLTSPLQIQSLALAPIELMAGLMTIDTNGNVNIAGNLNVAGKITTPNAEIKDITVDNFTIASPVTATQSGIIENGTITTNATAGKAMIPANVSEVIIKNNKITDYTLVYATPTGDTKNNVLYVKSKESGQFVIGFTNPLDIDVNFNWWIVQVNY